MGSAGILPHCARRDLVVCLDVISPLGRSLGGGRGLPRRRFANCRQRPIDALATAQLDGRPVVISGGSDGDATVRVSDLATGQPIGAPVTGHTDEELTVATAQLNGRLEVIFGSEDGTIRVWDLEARAHS